MSDIFRGFTQPLKEIRVMYLVIGHSYLHINLYSCHPTHYLKILSIIQTTLANAKRKSTINTYCVYTVLRLSWWWTVVSSETFRVLYQINMRNRASRW